MVQVVITDRSTNPSYGPSANVASQGTPLIHIHDIERHVFGNAVAVHVWGEMKIASGEYVLARELKLNTLQVLLLTPEPPRPTGRGYIVHKHIWHKGEYDNYASIMIIGDDASWQGPGTAPQDGSLWVNFEALGEE